MCVNSCLPISNINYTGVLCLGSIEGSSTILYTHLDNATYIHTYTCQAYTHPLMQPCKYKLQTADTMHPIDKCAQPSTNNTGTRRLDRRPDQTRPDQPLPTWSNPQSQLITGWGEEGGIESMCLCYLNMYLPT